MSAGRQVEVPQGLEKLVAVAALGPEWRAKVLSDPLAAAREAELELSDSERAIIKSVPLGALETMVDSFSRAVGPRPPSVAKTAVRAAAAALLATSLAGCGDDPGPATDGVRPDVPARRKPVEKFVERQPEEPKKPVIAEPKPESKAGRDSSDALRQPIKGTPSKGGVCTGIRADVPPPKKKANEEESPK